MAVYRVMLSGSAVKLRNAGVDEEHGFVKTEYVLARSAEEATAKAKAVIIGRLAKREGVHLGADLGRSLVWVVDDVDAGFGFLSLLKNEAFIFFPLPDE